MAKDTQPVELTGSKAQQKATTIVLFNALAITDTTLKWYGGGGAALAIADWNKYNRRTLWVRNTHDQAIDLTLAVQTSGVSFFDLHSGVAKTVQRVTVAAAGTNFPLILDSTDLKLLNAILTRDVSAYVKAGVAPTTGSITVELQMWAD